MTSTTSTDLIAISSGPHKAEVTIKPMIFAGWFFYPDGGWEDFRGFFDTIDDAKKWIQENLGQGGYPLQWAHIVHNNKIILKVSFDYRTETLDFEEVTE